MNFYIKEWPNKMATLMTDDGVVLWTFSNAEEARKVWRDWCKLQESKVSYKVESLGNNRLIHDAMCNT
jgi:hypothetical protein